MGCDIHCYAEVRKDGKWEKVGEVFENQYYRPNDPPSEWNQKLTDEPYHCRSYDTFAVLADVRNGSGFAGCDTGDGFKPIDHPRGLPKDVSPEIQKMSDEWDCDGHSHSHLTLRELASYDWKGQKTKHRGFVNAKEYKTFKKNGKPESWCGGVGGRDVRKVSTEEMDRVIDAGRDKDGISYYTQVEWEESYYESCKYFVDTVIPKLAKLGEQDDVRIVFWFDN